MPVAVRNPTVLALRAALAVRLWARLGQRLATQPQHSVGSRRRNLALNGRGRHDGNRTARGERNKPDPVGMGVMTHQKIPPVQLGSFWAGHPAKPLNAIISRFLQSDHLAQNEPSGMSIVVPSMRRPPPFHFAHEF